MLTLEAWFTYIVECSDGTYYCGTTPDLEKRISKHNAGQGAKYTAARKPVRLVYFEKYPDKSQAAQREYQIKQLTRKQKESIIFSSFLKPSSLEIKLGRTEVQPKIHQS
jgi:putative endonuclease